MKQLNEKLENQITIPLSSIARDLGCPKMDLERWLRERDDVTLRKKGDDRIEVDPLELRKCLGEVSS